MAREHDPFYARIRRIQRQHRRLAPGYALTIDKNNLIVPRPQTVTLAFPWKGLFLALVIAMVFKAHVMATLDPQTYDNRLNALARGHVAEQVAAWVMQPDPVSTTVARMMRMIRG